MRHSACVALALTFCGGATALQITLPELCALLDLLRDMSNRLQSVAATVSKSQDAMAKIIVSEDPDYEDDSLQPLHTLTMTLVAQRLCDRPCLLRVFPFVSSVFRSCLPSSLPLTSAYVAYRASLAVKKPKLQSFVAR